MNLYIARNGETLGPYNDSQAREYLKTGIFNPDDLGCKEGTEVWRSLSDLFPSQPSRIASSAKRSIIPIERVPTEPTHPIRSTPSLVAIFATVFFGIVSAGGVLMGGWYYFLREQKATPLIVGSGNNGKSPLAELFQKSGQLSGSVFVVTAGGQNYKLGAVRVGLYQREVLDSFFAEKRTKAANALKDINPRLSHAETEKTAAEQAASAASQKIYSVGYDSPLRATFQEASRQASKASDSASERYWELFRERATYLYGWYYFAGIPSAVTVTETDADGKFSVELPTNGNFAVVAEAKRSVGESTEHYYWAVPIAMDGSRQKSLMLTNNNLTSSGAKDSLVDTAD